MTRMMFTAIPSLHLFFSPPKICYKHYSIHLIVSPPPQILLSTITIKWPTMNEHAVNGNAVNGNAVNENAINGHTTNGHVTEIPEDLLNEDRQLDEAISHGTSLVSLASI